MNRNIFTGLATSIFAGVGVILFERLFLPKDGEMVVGTFGLALIVLAVALGLSVITYFILSLMNRRETCSFVTISFVCFGLTSAYLLYQIYPQYYVRSIAGELATILLNDAQKDKEKALLFISQNYCRFENMTDRLKMSSGSSVVSIYMTRSAMQRRPFLTFVAALHPRIITAPILVDAIVSPNICLDRWADEVYLTTRFPEKMPIFSTLKYDSGSPERHLLVSRKDAREIIANKYFEKKFYKGLLCPTKGNYLYVIPVGGACEPVTDKISMEYLLKPKDTLWMIYASPGDALLVSPEKYSHRNESFGNGLSDVVTALMNERGSHIATKNETFRMYFRKNKDGISIVVGANFQTSGDDNWISLDDEIVVKPSLIDRNEANGTTALLYLPAPVRSNDTINMILSAKKITIHVNKSGEEQHIQADIPLDSLHEAFEKFKQL